MDQFEIDSYRNNGYVIPQERLFTDDQIELLSAIIEECVESRADSYADAIDKPHIMDNRLLDFLLKDSLLDCVSCLCGNDIVLGSSHLFAKRAHVGRATPWHSDTAYLHRRLDDPTRVVSVWISVDGSNTSNGCMRLIPGSHKMEPDRPHITVSDSEYVLSTFLPDVDDTKATDVVLEPGQFSIHHPSILHSARRNESGRARTGLVGRYYPADVRSYTLAGNESPTLWLARGMSHGKNNYNRWISALT